MDGSIRRRASLRWSDLRRSLVIAGFTVASAPTIAPVQAQELCGGVEYPFPYTDVSGIGAAFCPGIMEAYVTGVSKGTSPSTFSPDETVTRVQMTTFLQRSIDQGLARSSQRAALNQWWTPQSANSMQAINITGEPISCVADGKAIWASTYGSAVVEVQANTGKVLGTWTGANNSFAILAAAGEVFVAGNTSPGKLFVIDPTQPPGPATLAASNLGDNPSGIAFDGTHIWTANAAVSPPGSVSIITPQATTPYPAGNVTTITTGFTTPTGILYDGANIWVTDFDAGKLLKLDATGAVLQAVTVGGGPEFPAFDGANIWVPSWTNSNITVVQASTGNVVATILTTATNLVGASFDGERILVTNYNGDTLLVYKAADLSLIADISTGGTNFPYAPCSDGINFWVPLAGTGYLLRF